MTVDFRKNPSPLSPLSLFNTIVAAVETFRFRGFTISHDLKWSSSTDTIIKKAQQRIYFLHQEHYCRPLVTTCSNSSPLVGTTEQCTPIQAAQYNTFFAQAVYLKHPLYLLLNQSIQSLENTPNCSIINA